MPEESNVENFFFVTFTFLMKSLCVNERWTIQQRAEWILIPKRSIAKKCCFHVFDLSRIWVENDKIIPTSEDWKVDVLIFPSVFFKNFEIYKW